MNLFKIYKPKVESKLIRKDLRLTVDNPEDLVVCRAVYNYFKNKAPRISISEVVDFLLHEKPFMTHVVLTGRNAKDELIEAADLVTEMSLIKHPFRDGIKAQKGIEF